MKPTTIDIKMVEIVLYQYLPRVIIDIVATYMMTPAEKFHELLKQHNGTLRLKDKESGNFMDVTKARSLIGFNQICISGGVTSGWRIFTPPETWIEYLSSRTLEDNVIKLCGIKMLPGQETEIHANQLAAVRMLKQFQALWDEI